MADKSGADSGPIGCHLESSVAYSVVEPGGSSILRCSTHVLHGILIIQPVSRKLIDCSLAVVLWFVWGVFVGACKPKSVP